MEVISLIPMTTGESGADEGGSTVPMAPHKIPGDPTGGQEGIDQILGQPGPPGGRIRFFNYCGKRNFLSANAISL